MNTLLEKRLSNLLTIKSLVTLIQTIVFAYLAITQNLDKDFLLVYTVIITFYFGTQAKKEGGEKSE